MRYSAVVILKLGHDCDTRYSSSRNETIECGWPKFTNVRWKAPKDPVLGVELVCCAALFVKYVFLCPRPLKMMPLGWWGFEDFSIKAGVVDSAENILRLCEAISHFEVA